VAAAFFGYLLPPDADGTCCDILLRLDLASLPTVRGILEEDMQVDLETSFASAALPELEGTYMVTAEHEVHPVPLDGRGDDRTDILLLLAGASLEFLTSWLERSFGCQVYSMDFLVRKITAVPFLRQKH
jgi:hypothetical protein